MHWLALILVATGHSFGSIGLLTIPSANQCGIVVLVCTPSTHFQLFIKCLGFLEFFLNNHLTDDVGISHCVIRVEDIGVSFLHSSCIVTTVSVIILLSTSYQCL